MGIDSSKHKVHILKLPLILKKYPLLSLSIMYFFFRLPNLTLLPIFNDEAIYLDWAWRMTHEPGFLFYSLYDAKQPFLLWIFGIAISIFPQNPLAAGRCVSIVFGLLTLVGLYKLTARYVSKSASIISAGTYVIIPLFVFYDRQVLMESAVATIGVWSCYLSLRMFETKRLKYALLTGLVIGIGYMIKSTALIFLVALCLVGLALKVRKKTDLSLRYFALLLSGFLLSTFLLFLQPMFWHSLSSNSRYSLTFSELVHFPFSLWLGNILGNGEIAIVFLTPGIFLMALLGSDLLFKKGNAFQKYIVLWLWTSLILQVLVVRGITQRYAVPFLPLFLVPFGYLLSNSVRKIMRWKWALLLSIFLLPLFLSVVQLVSPLHYLSLVQKFTRFSDYSSYVSGGTSGYGLLEVVTTIEKLSKNKEIIVGFAMNTGNPESFLQTAFLTNDKITASYLDRSLLGDAVNGVDCLQVKKPVYFVSRRKELAGLDQFFESVTFIYNPYNSNVFYGIWTLRTQCSGKILPVELVKT